jgi:hypothetical protein
VRTLICTMTARMKNAIFGTIFALCLLVAIFPPFYLAASGVRVGAFGIPLSVLYWLLDALVLGLAVWALYAVESIRGEIVEDGAA